MKSEEDASEYENLHEFVKEIDENLEFEKGGSDLVVTCEEDLGEDEVKISYIASAINGESMERSTTVAPEMYTPGLLKEFVTDNYGDAEINQF